MKILKIKEIKRKRIKVIFENEMGINLNIRMLMEDYLHVGKELSENEIEELVKKSDEIDALDKAINYIAYQMRTVFEVENRLRREEYSNDVIGDIINKLIGEGYLDDDKYAVEYYSSYRKKCGIYKIKSGLKRKGVSEEIINKLSMGDDEEVAYRLVRKKYGNKLEKIDYEQKGRIYKYLSQKGFLFETINKVVNCFEEEI